MAMEQQRTRYRLLYVCVSAVVFLCVMPAWNIYTHKQLFSHDYLRAGGRQMLSHIRPGWNKQTSHSQKVLIISYQRSGSSYLGDLFGGYPGVLYVYEPLDALYASLYGSADGWNIPSDITNYCNGSARKLPALETETVSMYLDDVLNCRMSSLPAEFYHHRFWKLFRQQQKSLETVRVCIHDALVNSTDCGHILNGTCNERFNSSDEVNIKMCHNVLKYMNEEPIQMDQSNDSFVRHHQCLLSGDEKIKTCKTELEDMCLRTNMSVVKTVRLTMASVWAIIEHNPGIKVLHLVRDPRGTLLSRSKLLSSYGLHSEMLPRDTFKQGYPEYARTHKDKVNKRIEKTGKMNFTREARMLCHSIYNDVMTRRRLEDQYPDTFRQVVFDEFVRDVEKNVKDLYKFIGIPYSTNISLPGGDSVHIATKWRHELEQSVVDSITDVCAPVYSLINSPAWH